MRGAALEDREREGCGCEARGSRRRWLSGTRDTRCGPPPPEAVLTPAHPDGAALRAHTGVWGLPPLLFVAQNHSCRFVTLLPLSATCPFLFLFNATSFI